MPDAPTISELLQAVEAYNAAHANHLKYPVTVTSQPDALMDNLYALAVAAAVELRQRFGFTAQPLPQPPAKA
jgi:hypothetical protein